MHKRMGKLLNPSTLLQEENKHNTSRRKQKLAVLRHFEPVLLSPMTYVFCAPESEHQVQIVFGMSVFD